MQIECRLSHIGVKHLERAGILPEVRKGGLEEGNVLAGRPIDIWRRGENPAWETEVELFGVVRNGRLCIIKGENGCPAFLSLPGLYDTAGCTRFDESGQLVQEPLILQTV